MSIQTSRVDPALVELDNVSRHFGSTPDMASVLVRRVAKTFGVQNEERKIIAVDGATLAVRKGEVVGLVGESGCGKSTLGRMAAGILRPTEGRVVYQGVDIDSLGTEARRHAKLKVQMIFQDPYSSLNPRMRVENIVGQAPRLHGLVTRSDLGDYVDAQLERAGLDPTLKQRYPHQFSGGQRQRIGIARALAVQPSFLICDEAVAALDVSIQAQIINLFMDLREQLDLTYLFISHDLGVVEHLSDRVVVMYLGRIVEEAPTQELFSQPNHPYTQGLLSQIPRLDRRRSTYTVVKGEIASPLNPPSGCHFHPRCPHVMPRCKVEVPLLREIGIGHRSACHLNDTTSAGTQQA